jgi:hypothetical protein
MINLPTIPVDVLLLAGRAAFLVFSFVVAAVAFVRWRRAAQRDTECVTTRTDALLAHFERMESLLTAADARLTTLEERLDSHLRSAAPASSESYRIAIRLARCGAPREELMSGCGLTQQEADLVTRLHGPQQRGARQPAAA